MSNFIGKISKINTQGIVVMIMIFQIFLANSGYNSTYAHVSSLAHIDLKLVGLQMPLNNKHILKKCPFVRGTFIRDLRKDVCRDIFIFTPSYKF